MVMAMSCFMFRVLWVNLDRRLEGRIVHSILHNVSKHVPVCEGVSKRAGPNSCRRVSASLVLEIFALISPEQQISVSTGVFCWLWCPRAPKKHLAKIPLRDPFEP